MSEIIDKFLEVVEVPERCLDAEAVSECRKFTNEFVFGRHDKNGNPLVEIPQVPIIMPEMKFPED